MFDDASARRAEEGQEAARRAIIAEAKAALSAAPGDFVAGERYAQALERAGRMRDARATLLSLYERDDTNLRVMTNLARLLSGARENEMAGKLLLRGVQCHPGDVGAQINAGRFLLQTGDAAGAVGFFEAGARLAPASAEARLCLAASLRRLGRPVHPALVAGLTRADARNDPFLVQLCEEVGV